MFISLDGGDGCGKSTQLDRLGDWLRSQGREVVVCRDPGSTPLGDAVRNILLHGKEINISDLSEMFLFMAARSQMIGEVIQPAIDAGKTVLSDRFLLSSFVYQGYAGGVPLDVLETVGKIATQGIQPDLTLVLDIPYEVAVKRRGLRSAPDRMEQKGEEYHQKVRNGFLVHATTNPKHYVIVDATPSTDEVESQIRAIVKARTHSMGTQQELPLHLH